MGFTQAPAFSKSGAGFTLIELLVVIAILGVLATIMLVLINPAGQLAKVRDAGRKQNLAELSKALTEYYVFNSAYPNPGPSLMSDSSEGSNWIPELVTGGYLKFLPKDPRQASLPIYIAFGSFFEKFGWKINDVFAAGTSYYVDTNHPSANDANPGTEASPWKTIQKAANTLVAGDTVYIKQGTYTGLVSPVNTGNAGAWITYSAYPGQERQVVLNGAVGGSRFKVVGKSYIKVSGFKIENVPTISGGGGIGIEVIGPGSNITISGNYTYNTYGSAIGVWGAAWGQGEPDSVLTDLIIENNKVELANNGGWNENITVANGVDRFEIRNNELLNGGDNTNGGEGIDVKYGVRNAKIYGNLLHNLTRNAIYVDGATRYVNNVEVFGNTVYNNRSGAGGIHVVKEGTGTVDNIKVYNNIVYGNDRDGILLYKHIFDNGVGMSNITLINNTTWNNGLEAIHWGGGVKVDYSTAQNVIVRNNIAYQNQDYQIQTNAGTVDHNLTINPLFMNIATGDFHLNSGSPAIDIGSTLSAPATDYDGNTRPVGAAVDIGAYEYGGVPPSPPLPTSPPSSPSPSPLPTSPPSAPAFKYLYSVTPDFQSFILWTGLENSSDAEIYSMPNARCKETPPDLSYNFCISSN